MQVLLCKCAARNPSSKLSGYCGHRQHHHLCTLLSVWRAVWLSACGMQVPLVCHVAKCTRQRYQYNSCRCTKRCALKCYHLVHVHWSPHALNIEMLSRSALVELAAERCRTSVSPHDCDPLCLLSVRPVEGLDGTPFPHDKGPSKVAPCYAQNSNLHHLRRHNSAGCHLNVHHTGCSLRP